MFNNMRIGLRFFIITVLAAIVPVIIVAIIIGSTLTNTINTVASSVSAAYDDIAANVIGQNLKGDAQVTARQIDTYLAERIANGMDWAAGPQVQAAARSAAAVAVSKGLTDLSIAEAEASMNASRMVIEDLENTLY